MDGHVREEVGGDGEMQTGENVELVESHDCNNVPQESDNRQNEDIQFKVADESPGAGGGIVQIAKSVEWWSMLKQVMTVYKL